MRIRAGFVSNSSSSSFVISLNKLNKLQVAAIKRHIDIGRDFGVYARPGDEWDVYECDDGYLRGSTCMDNFNMYEFLIKIGIDSNDVEWSY